MTATSFISVFINSAALGDRLQGVGFKYSMHTRALEMEDNLLISFMVSSLQYLGGMVQTSTKYMIRHRAGGGGAWGHPPPLKIALPENDLEGQSKLNTYVVDVKYTYDVYINYEMIIKNSSRMSDKHLLCVSYKESLYTER